MEETDVTLLPVTQSATCTAKLLTAQQRQHLAIQALAGSQSVSDLANEFEVSRNFIYRQTATAQQALHQAFAPPSADPEVLFYLPVTKTWLRQLIIALVLLCHSSFRGAQALLRAVLDVHVSIGTVHNVLDHAVAAARAVNAKEDLSGIRIGGRARWAKPGPGRPAVLARHRRWSLPG
jgi:hypothetical protein